MNLRLFFCSIGLTQASDRAQTSELVEALQNKNISRKYLEIVKELNRSNKTVIKIDTTLTEVVWISTEIRHGDSPSLTRFYNLNNGRCKRITHGGYQIVVNLKVMYLTKWRNSICLGLIGIVPSFGVLSHSMRFSNLT